MKIKKAQAKKENVKFQSDVSHRHWDVVEQAKEFHRQKTAAGIIRFVVENWAESVSTRKGDRLVYSAK